MPLSFLLLAGVIPGIYLLRFANDWILRSTLGIVVMGMAVEMLIRNPAQKMTKKSNPVFLIIIGVISGVLAGLYGIGALLVAYVSRTTDNKSQFRANICCVFLVDNIFRFFLYWITGILNKDILLLTLFLSPAVILGMIIGIKVDSKMNDKMVKNTVITLLIFSGTMLFLKNFFYH